MHKWLTCLVLFAFILSGCNKPKETPIPNSVVFSFPDQDTAYYRALLNEFYAQNHGITVVLEPIAANKLSEQKGEVQVITWNITGDKVDWSPGSYLDLQPFIDQEGSFNRGDFFSGSFLPFTNADMLVGMPYGIDPTMLYYNQSILDQQQATPPDSALNWDSFLTTAALLTDREKNIYGYAAAPDYGDSVYYLYQHGGRLLDESGKPALDSSVNIEALGWYSRLFTALNIAPTIEQSQKAFGYSDGVLMRGVMDGKIGMWSAAFSRREPSTGASSSRDFEYRISTLPQDQAKATSGALEAYAITKDARNKEAAWKLILFLDQKANPRLVPARISVAGSLEFAKLVGAEAATIAQDAASHMIVIDYPGADNLIKARKAFLEAVASVVGLKATPRQALETAQKLVSP